MRLPALCFALGSALILGYAGPAFAQCSFDWSCKGNRGCISVMQKAGGTASGAPDMAACERARRKWADMGVPPTSPCTCAGAAAPSGLAGGATTPLGIMQQTMTNAFANIQRQAEESARLGAQASASLGAEQAQALEAVHEQQLLAVQAEDAARRKKQEDLLSQLARAIPGTELGAQERSATIDLRAGTSFFGRPSNPTGTDTTVVPGATIEMKPPPDTPQGRPVEPLEKERIDEAYRKAVEDHARAEEQRRKLEEERKEAERKRAEAERKYQEQQARVQAVPQDQPQARKNEDDKLAEAEKLLKEATDLDQKASDELDKAERNLGKAKQDVERTERARSQLESAPRAQQDRPN